MHKSQKTVRRCSVCRLPGHTKRSCARNRQKDVHRTAPSSVFVSVTHSVTPSPHVVDLRPSDERQERPKLPVYQEKHPVFSAWLPVDFAATVRETNARAPLPQPVPIASAAKKSGIPGIWRAVKGHAYTPIQHIQDMGLRWGSSLADLYTQTARKIHLPRLSGMRLVQAACVVLIFLLPLPGIAYVKKVSQTGQRVFESGTQGFLSLQSSTVAAFQADLTGAEHDLTQALAAFSTATSLLEKEHAVLQSLVSLVPGVGGQLESRRSILQAGQHIALGNTYLIKGVEEASSDALPLTDRLQVLRQHLRSTIPQYEAASEQLQRVRLETLPVEFQQPFDELRLLAATVVDDMRDVVDLIQMISVLFGQDDFRRYLVVFQNNRELRATGGFIGSFAIVDVQKGKIVNIDVPGGGSYDVKGQLDVFVKPPLPLQLVNERWEFQDANWWPDFPASAEKLAWFYRHARQTTVDGVIAVNASVLETFLGVVGPVSNEQHDVNFDADSALDTLQYKVEFDYDTASNTPKAIIGDLVQDFLAITRNLDKVDAMRLVVALHNAAQEKEVQLYMTDSSVQDQLRSFGWTGEIVSASPPQDYLFVTATNMQGQKSDAKIHQDIEHTVAVDADGSAVVEVRVKRTHEGRPGELFYGGANISFLRLYVPQGAELLDAGGFTYPPEDAFHVPEPWYTDDEDLMARERDVGIHAKTGTHISESFGKTVFGNWMVTEPGTTEEAFVVYRLPFQLSTEYDTQTNDWFTSLVRAPKQISRYSLVLQKQSGINSFFRSAVHYPEGWQPVWRSDDDVAVTANGAVVEGVLEKDRSFGIVLEHKE